MKRGEKLEVLIYLERELEEKSKKSKIIEFGSIFAEKLTSESNRNFRTRRLQKIEITIKID